MPAILLSLAETFRPGLIVAENGRGRAFAAAACWDQRRGSEESLGGLVPRCVPRGAFGARALKGAPPAETIGLAHVYMWSGLAPSMQAPTDRTLCVCGRGIFMSEEFCPALTASARPGAKLVLLSWIWSQSPQNCTANRSAPSPARSTSLQPVGTTPTRFPLRCTCITRSMDHRRVTRVPFDALSAEELWTTRPPSIKEPPSHLRSTYHTRPDFPEPAQSSTRGSGRKSMDVTPKQMALVDLSCEMDHVHSAVHSVS